MLAYRIISIVRAAVATLGQKIGVRERHGSESGVRHCNVRDNVLLAGIGLAKSQTMSAVHIAKALDIVKELHE